MTSKYYAHFVTDAPELAGLGEFSGVVELQSRLDPRTELVQLRALLAKNLDLPTDEIRILHWGTLH